MPARLPNRVARAVGRLVRRRRAAHERTHRPHDSQQRAAERLFVPGGSASLDVPEAPEVAARPGETPEADPADEHQTDDTRAGRVAPDLTLPARVVGILTHDTARRLQPVAQVDVLVPGSRAFGVEVTPGSVLAVERSALQGGPWSGAEAAVGTPLLMEILEWVSDARDAQAPVVLLESVHASNVGTNLLRSGADVVFPRFDGSDPEPGPPQSPIFGVLDVAALAATKGDR